tara:strand:+ start:288 stop:722 length:435 start_codon:yes stop_codon:yes gene_type:complete
MKLREYIIASIKPAGEPKMLSKTKVYACELGPYWRDIKKDIVEGNSDITVEVFKAYWADRYSSSEVEYPNIFWADQSDYVERNIFQDENGNYFIRLKHGWAPVLSSLKIGKLACFMYTESQPSVFDECGLVYIYPWAKEYGKRI